MKISTQPKITFFQGIIISLIILISFSYLVIYSTDPYFKLVTSDLFNSFTPILAAICLLYVRKFSKFYSKRTYLAWTFFSLALISWGLGEMIYTFLEIVLQQEPFPSLADLFYLGVYPLFVIGIFYLPSKKLKHNEYTKILLDMSIIIISAGIIIWNFLIEPIFNSSDSLALALISAAYPIGDLLLIFGLLILIFRPLTNPMKGSLILLILGIIAMIISDFLFAYQSLLGTYVSGSTIDAGWMVSFILIGLSGILHAEKMYFNANNPEYFSENKISGKVTSWYNYLTYFWILVPFSLLIWGHYNKINTEFHILALSIGIIIGLIIIRHILVLNENKKLYKQLESSHGELEIRVKQRTEDLANINRELKNEIIEREKTEQELKLKAKLLDSSNDSIMLHDLDGNPIYMNESAYKSLKYNKEEMMHISLHEMESQQEQNKIPSRVKELMEKGHVFFESENIRKDGSIKPVEVYTQLIEFNNQKLILGIARDISERKKAERKIKEYQEHLEDLVKLRTSSLKHINEKLRKEISERKRIQNKLKKSEIMYRSIFENTGTATIILENDGNVSLINEETSILSGYSKEEMEGKQWTEFIVPSDIVKIKSYENLRKSTSERIPRRYETTGISKNGQIKNIILTIDRIPETELSVVSFLDITELRKVENEIKSSLKEKEVLLREIHHRVNNNMQIISSLLSIQSNYLDNKKAREIFQESQNRIKSMSMVHERLYQSKNLARINMKEYVKSITTGILVSSKKNSDLIKLKINFENIWLNMDTVIPCGLIITELVTNSLKYAFPDNMSGEINIDLKSLGKGEFLLCVWDNGVGISKDIKFEELKTLGLLLIDSLVKQLDGNIILDRSQGTLFKIKFKELKYKDRL